jgi:hypothetical protein
VKNVGFLEILRILGKFTSGSFRLRPQNLIDHFDVDLRLLNELLTFLFIFHVLLLGLFLLRTELILYPVGIFIIFASVSIA